MTLFERSIQYQIIPDESYEPYYSSDQANVSYPTRFATVTLKLLDTPWLCDIADQIRMENSFPPLTPLGGPDDKYYDGEAWYDFYVGLNDFTKSKLDSCIEIVVQHSDHADNEKTYRIDLSEAEQKAVFRRLDNYCQDIYNKSCEQLLVESRSEMYTGKIITLKEMAELIGMNQKELKAALERDGYLVGGTQTKEAAKMKIFFVERSAARGAGGVYHTRLKVFVTPYGQHFIKEKYL